MELNATENAILALLRSALTGREAVLPPDTDWAALYAEAEAQAVTPLIADRLPAPLPEEERARWESRSGQYISFFYRLMEEQDRLVGVFRDAGIPMAILKGAAAAVYYPEPALRTMGDVDFIVPPERFDEALALMEASGFEPAGEADARHAAFRRGGVSFELHRRFGFKGFDADAYISGGLARPAEGRLEDYAFPMLPPLENGVVLLCHMCQHLRLRMGLRQVLDWMMYVDRVLDDDFWENGFRQAAESLGLSALAVTVARMCQLYLGLSERITWCAGADERLCGELLETLFASGNFAGKLGREGDVEGALNAFRYNGFFRHLQRRGLQHWAAARRHRWLRPFAWLYQIFRYLAMAVRRGIGPAELREQADGSRRYTRMLHELGLDRAADETAFTQKRSL